MGVLDTFREFFSRAKGKPQPGSAVPDLSLWEEFRRIGGGLTPAQVSTIIRSADSGEMASLIDLANEMRQKDGHLQCVLQTLETSIECLQWELVLPGDTKKKKSRRGGPQRKFVEAQLRGHRAFKRMVAHLTGSRYYGYAVTEIVWKRDNGRLVPADFKCLSARRFGFRAEDGRFVWRDERMPRDGVDVRETYPDKFLIAQPRVNGDVACREGLVRVLMWLALFRNWSMSDWLKLAEMSWKPYRKGTYQKTASKEDIAGLKAVLAGMATSGVAVHPDTVTVETTFAQSSGTGGGASGGGSHAALYSSCAGEMSKAVLGQTLSTEQGRVGSQALGNVHNEVRKDIRNAFAEYLADVITHDLIEPMVRLNFGPSAPVPQLRFITKDAADMKSMAEAIQILVGPTVAMKIGADWAHDEMGIPEPGADDQLLGVYVDVSAFANKPKNDTDGPTKYAVGDRVKVKPGMSHDPMTDGKPGTIRQISTEALGIEFDGMAEIHKWHVDAEVERYAGEPTEDEAADNEHEADDE